MGELIKDWDSQRLRQFIQAEIRRAPDTSPTPTAPATMIEQFGGLDMPTGTILASAARPVSGSGSVLDPPGWFICDGRVKKKAEYPTLARLIGGLWDNGASPAADEFIIPDLRRAFIIGQNFDRPDGGSGGTAEAGNISNVIVDPASGVTFPLAILTFFVKH
jgi:hypothetical protein